MSGQKRFARCIVVDDDPDILLSARLLLRDLFTEIAPFQSPQEALDSLRREPPDVVLLDANFGRGATNAAEGFHWLGEILAADPQAVVVMITAHAGVQVAVEAMKRGATDFVSKPWSNERLLTTVRTAAALRNSRADAGGDAKPGSAPGEPAGSGASPLLGQAPSMARVYSLIERAAPTDANVLILGENGTGKELVARELHRRSRRSGKVLVSVDLGAVTESLFDSELFGHVKGAFTDAKGDRVGRMKAAEGGTLFLDEIGNLPLHLQPKLLTALEQRQIVPVGSNQRSESMSGWWPRRTYPRPRSPTSVASVRICCSGSTPSRSRSRRFASGARISACSPAISFGNMRKNTESRSGCCRIMSPPRLRRMTGAGTSERFATPASAR
jgi:DNA-binding NtrC family response regulator